MNKITRLRFQILLTLSFIFCSYSELSFADSYMDRLNDAMNGYRLALSQMKSSKEKFDFLYGAVAERNFSKLYIDKFDQDREIVSGQVEAEYEENSPNYKAGMKNGFNYIRKHLDAELNLDFIVQVHNAAVKGVIHGSDLSVTPSVFINEPYAKGIQRGSTMGFPDVEAEYNMLHSSFLRSLPSFEIRKLAFLRVSEEAKRDWKTFHFIVDPYPLEDPGSIAPFQIEKYLAHIYYDEEGRALSSNVVHKYRLPKYAPGEWKALVNQQLAPYLRSYDQAIKLANQSLNPKVATEKRLKAISIVLRAIHISHIFWDANGRTLILLLNQLLIKNNFPPAVLDYPGVFSGYKGTRELIEEIKIGIANFLEIRGDLPTYPPELKPSYL